MYVSFDGVNGKVTSFSMDWFDLEFPSVETALKMDEVYEKMFDSIGLELVYSGIYNEGSVEPNARRKQPEIKLIYNVKQDKPAVFDAFTGGILDYSGKPFVEKRLSPIPILTAICANQIASLASTAFRWRAPSFGRMRQLLKDFLRLLAKAAGYYGSFDDDDELEDMYNRLIRRRW